MIVNQLKHLFFFLLTFLLGVQTTHAKTEVIIPQPQKVFFAEQSQKINPLQKEVQPNIGFLKEKTKFVAVQRSSAVNSYNFPEQGWCYLAYARGRLNLNGYSVSPRHFGTR